MTEARKTRERLRARARAMCLQDFLQSLNPTEKRHAAAFLGSAVAFYAYANAIKTEEP